METKKFRTNIKCSGCIDKVTPGLNATVGEGKWEVDLADPSKILKVPTTVDESLLKEALSKVGYKAERI